MKLTLIFRAFLIAKARNLGAFLPDLCDAQRINPHRSMLEMLSSGAAPGPSEPASGPVSDTSAPALAPSAM
ncbi:hypothetical protein F2Q69_00061803 [Brassica cretica]|uniref:Uncharacterized protein n=1 Tax=Brassica cretica TaxID=69181 RepID=A0A8S9RL44_BRACR|nr:hypothetical protein F2Q69_00061803 [Brassica cretica]